MPVDLARMYVQPSTVTPLPYGLMSAATLVDESDSHWQAGIQFQPDVCDAAATTISNCPPAETTKTATSDGMPTMGADPFTVYTWIDCNPVGFWEEAEQRTRTALVNGEARAAEFAFWTGQTDAGPDTLRPHLAENTAVTGSPAGTTTQLAATVVITGASVVRAIGELEGALSDCYGGVGVLHAQRKLIATMADHTQIERNGAQLRTIGGTPVAFGAGYPGTSPAGATPSATTSWIYATGAVAVRRSGIALTSTREEALNRLENSLTLIAERTYVIAWDCCLFAALVDLTL